MLHLLLANHETPPCCGVVVGHLMHKMQVRPDDALNRYVMSSDVAAIIVIIIDNVYHNRRDDR